MEIRIKAALLAAASLVIVAVLCTWSYSRLFSKSTDDVLRSHLMSESLLAKHLAEAEISLLSQKLIRLLSEESSMQKQSGAQASSQFVRSDFVEVAVMAKESGQWVAEWAALRPGYTNRWTSGAHIKLLQGLSYNEVKPGKKILRRLESPDGQSLFALMIPLSAESDVKAIKIGVGLFTPSTFSKVIDPFRHAAKEAGVIDDQAFALAFTRQQYVGSSLQSHPVVSTLLSQMQWGNIRKSTNTQGEEVLFASQSLDNSNIMVFVSQEPGALSGGFFASLMTGLGYAVAVGLFFVGGLFWLFKSHSFEEVGAVSEQNDEPEQKVFPKQVEIRAEKEELEIDDSPTRVQEVENPAPARESKKVELEEKTDPRLTNIGECLEHVLQRMGSDINKEKIKIEKKIGNLGKVRMPRGQLETVFEEILKNAIEALEGTREKVIEIRSQHDTRTLKLQISDSGKGLPHSVADKVFDPLFSYEKSGKEGMGLTVVRGLIRAIGGSVRIESSPQSTSWQKTRVIVDLPLAEPLAEDEKTHITLTSEYSDTSVEQHPERLAVTKSQVDLDALPESETESETGLFMKEVEASSEAAGSIDAREVSDEFTDDFKIVSRSDTYEEPIEEEIVEEYQEVSPAPISDQGKSKRSLFKEDISEDTPDLELNIPSAAKDKPSFVNPIRKPKVRSKS